MQFPPETRGTSGLSKASRKLISKAWRECISSRNPRDAASPSSKQKKEDLVLLYKLQAARLHMCNPAPGLLSCCLRDRMHELIPFWCGSPLQHELGSQLIVEFAAWLRYCCGNMSAHTPDSAQQLPLLKYEVRVKGVFFVLN
jgi:hypothetical protein